MVECQREMTIDREREWLSLRVQPERAKLVACQLIGPYQAHKVRNVICTCCICMYTEEQNNKVVRLVTVWCSSQYKLNWIKLVIEVLL